GNGLFYTRHEGTLALRNIAGELWSLPSPLKIVRSAGILTVSWVTATGTEILETTQDLTNSTQWRAIPEVTSGVDGSRSWTVTQSLGQSFFRLRQSEVNP
ncbi:MAG: hypothetical protein DME18_13060, partial [Verrucomicrobia bacterium]